MMKKIISYFVKGLLVFMPVALTVYVIYVVFRAIDGWLPFLPFPGMGFVITVLLIILTGWMTSTIFAKGIINWIDSLLKRLPFVKLLYNSLKDLTAAFTGEKKIFDRPVLVTLMPASNVKIMGFITHDTMESLGIKDSVAVYVPQAYNFAGHLLIVPKEQVTPINKNGAEVMAFIVSAGVSLSANKVMPNDRTVGQIATGRDKSGASGK
jgi:uncharacterized membrane protein